MARRQRPYTKWEKNERERPYWNKYTRKEHAARVNAAFNAFCELYGHDCTKLEIWQTLCKDLEVDIGTSIVTCVKILDDVFVNIFDFAKAMQERDSALKFDTLKELQDYSWEEGGFSPLGKAKANLMLETLLVHMRGNKRRKGVGV